MKNNKKIKMTFNVAPEVRRLIKNFVEELGYKSESAFCNEAIEEYLSKLQYDSIGTYMNKLLVQAVDCTIERHSDRLVDMLFKLAVSIEKQNLIASGEYDDYDTMVTDFYNYIIGEKENLFSYEHEFLMQKTLCEIINKKEQ